MVIKFMDLYIKNFMSIGTATLNLDNQGYVLISGINTNPNDNAKSNGSGKSSLFEAIVWCLTGETSRGVKDVVNLYGDDGALVELNFIVDNVTYKLLRTKDHSKYKTNLKIYINGQDSSGKGVRASEQILKEYLPDLTSSLISSVIILGQGMPMRFTNNTPSGRKDVLEKLCKSDFMIDDLKNRCSDRKGTLSKELRVVEDALLTNTTKREILTGNRLRVDSQLQSVSKVVDYDSLIVEATASYNEYHDIIHALQEQRDSANQHNNSLHTQLLTLSQEYDKQVADLTAKSEADINKFFDLRADISVEIKRVNAEITRINNIREVCPTCGQKLHGVIKPDTSKLQADLKNFTALYSEYDLQYNTLVAKLNGELNALQQEYNKAKEETQKQFTDNTSLRELSSKLETYNDKLRECANKLEELKLKKEMSVVTLNNLKAELTDIDEKLKQIDADILYNTNEKETINSRLQIINKFNTIITRDFRGYLLENIIQYINRKAKEYCKKIFNTELLDFYREGNDIVIAYDGKSYESLSGGEKQKVDLIIQFSLRDMLCSTLGFSTNILALDEIFDNLDDMGSKNIIDFISYSLSDISSIFIISHHGQELSIPCDLELIVKKNVNGVSEIL